MKIAMARIQNSTPFCAILGISKDKKGNKKALVSFSLEMFLPKWKKRRVDQYFVLARQACD